MNEPKHSPLPWRVNMEFGDTVLDRDGKHIATCFCEDEKSPHTIDCANAALIVKAVNGYEWFLKALPIIEDYLTERHREYKMWAGREDTGKARAIKAEIGECEDILNAAKGVGIYG